MRRLIHLFFISIILIYSNNLLSQDIGIQLDRNLGVIESVFIKHGKTVFELDSANNNIKNIYVFSDDSLSERFLQDPVYDFRPRRSLELHRGVKLYIDTYRSVDYAKNYRQNSFSGIVGSVTEVDDIEIDYHLRIGDNRIIGIVGKIKSINDIDIDYHKNYSENQRGGYMGKVKDIGDISLKYHNRHTYSDLGGYVGKLKEINDVSFKYNESYSGNVNKGSVGKISEIGDIKIEYFKNYSTNSASGIVGKFKSISGVDKRIIVY